MPSAFGARHVFALKSTMSWRRKGKAGESIEKEKEEEVPKVKNKIKFLCLLRKLFKT